MEESISLTVQDPYDEITPEQSSSQLMGSDFLSSVDVPSNFIRPSGPIRSFSTSSLSKSSCLWVTNAEDGKIADSIRFVNLHLFLRLIIGATTASSQVAI